jgi:hypothetical protein
MADTATGNGQTRALLQLYLCVNTGKPVYYFIYKNGSGVGDAIRDHQHSPSPFFRMCVFHMCSFHN